MFDVIIEIIEENLALFSVLGIVIFIASFFIVKRYFNFIKFKTGYNPISKINIVLCAAIIIAPYLGSRFDDKEGISILVIVLFAAPIVILIIRNFKIKKPIHIILVSIIQVILGVVIAIAALFVITLAMIGVGPRTNNQNYNDNDEYISPAAQSWMGKEYDVNRAIKLGFDSVEDAIDAGFSYDGRRL